MEENITPEKFWKQICLEVLEEALDNKFSFSKIPKGSTKEDLIKKNMNEDSFS